MSNSSPHIHYFAQVGSELIELGDDPAMKEDPFKPLQTGGDIGHWEAEMFVGETRYVAVSNDSLKDAHARLLKQLPEDIRPPDRTKKAAAADTVKGSAAAGGSR